MNKTRWFICFAIEKTVILQPLDAAWVESHQTTWFFI